MTVLRNERHRPPPEEAGSCALCRLSFSSDRECIQRTAGGAEMPPGEMQIDRRLLKVAMPEQHLAGAQVGAGVEQMRGKAVAQSVGMDVLVFKAGACGGLLTGVPENLGGDRMTRRMPSVAGEQPIGGLAFQPAPVDAERIEQLGAEHDIAVLASLASADMNDHALAVDIADLQMRHFCAPCARGIERHQQDAMKRKLCSVDQTRYFFLAEYLGQVQNLLRIRRFGNAPAALQHLDIEKAQGCQALGYGVGGQLPPSEQRGLILANVLGAKLIGRTMEVPTEMLDRVDVNVDGGLGIVAAP